MSYLTAPTLAARHLAGICLVVAVTALSVPAVGQVADPQPVPDPIDAPPPGAVDGWPVGSDEPHPEIGAPDDGAPGEAEVGAAAAVTRYFGSGAYQAVRASVAATTRPCSISNDGLTALVLAPIFKESSGALSPSTAPAPMTLSRYDEWTGTYPTNAATDTNKNSNYGLYAFRDPATPYTRAFWHPGIGIWQYDSAGLGAPFTAIERMDTGILGADVARVMSNRYCAASGTDLQRRYAAWTDWGYPCTLCEEAFADLMSTRSPSSPSGFGSLQLVAGIDRLGGAQTRTCGLGDGSQVTCWYVDPALAQGARWWVTGLPVDDGNPRSGTTPLSRPFYVYKQGGREHRVWLREDTGYAIDISGWRQLGRNARPRLNQAGSGVTWTQGSSLCDLTALRGRCGASPSGLAAPVAGLTAVATSVSGSAYLPLVGDFDGNGFDDVLWYAPGSAADTLWWFDGPGTFSSVSLTVNGHYAPTVGDVDGDDRDDILWYAQVGADSVWRAPSGRTVVSSPIELGPGAVPFLVDDAPGGGQELVVFVSSWNAYLTLTWNGSGFAAIAAFVRPAGQRPIVGGFGGPGSGDDVLWYGPGAISDELWLSQPGGGHASVHVDVAGASYQPFVGDFDGDGHDDVFWFGPGTIGDFIWWGGAGGVFASTPTSVIGTYAPIVADLANDGGDDIFWHAVGPPVDYWWQYGAGRTASSASAAIGAAVVVHAGRFGNGDGLLFYGPGTIPDALWYR